MLTALVFACGDPVGVVTDSGSTGSEDFCIPGTLVECYCGFLRGEQECLDGLERGPCVCTPPRAGHDDGWGGLGLGNDLGIPHEHQHRAEYRDGLRLWPGAGDG